MLRTINTEEQDKKYRIDEDDQQDRIFNCNPGIQR